MLCLHQARPQPHPSFRQDTPERSSPCLCSLPLLTRTPSKLQYEIPPRKTSTRSARMQLLRASRFNAATCLDTQHQRSIKPQRQLVTTYPNHLNAWSHVTVGAGSTNLQYAPSISRHRSTPRPALYTTCGVHFYINSCLMSLPCNGLASESRALMPASAGRAPPNC